MTLLNDHLTELTQALSSPRPPPSIRALSTQLPVTYLPAHQSKFLVK